MLRSGPRQNCDLKVVYRPSVRAFVSFLIPLKSVLDRFPNTNLASRFKSVLTQEEIRRSFLSQQATGRVVDWEPLGFGALFLTYWPAPMLLISKLGNFLADHNAAGTGYRCVSLGHSHTCPLTNLLTSGAWSRAVPKLLA
jgi:hypothetical protein